ncbi:response regulator transcription factor [Clostridium sardiniense]|uniref:response regulator transcription factor n=1 Tax=Clostridium sardiniense TaxID=29369 RepID=UPI003D33B32D
MDKRVLIVEDEASINDILSRALSKEGYIIKSAYTGKEALEYMQDFKPHLVLLDIMLPDTTGFELAKHISNNSYVIMITARNEISDKLKCMELGADDYITKPFDIREVKMRVKVVLRREEKIIEREKELGFCINAESRSVVINSKVIDLNRKEFDLLYYLYKNKNRVFSRSELLDKVWGIDFEGEDRTVDVHIRRIRSKLGEYKDTSKIETIFGIGYVMR